MKKITKLLILVLAVFAFSTPVASADSLFNNNLYFGIQGDTEVVKLQEFLTEQGVYSGPVNGNFFSLTLQAVRQFQTANGVSPASGYFGPISRNKANAILSGQIASFEEQAPTSTATSDTPSSSTSAQAQIDSLIRQVQVLQQQLQGISQGPQAATTLSSFTSSRNFSQSSSFKPSASLG